ncbi:Uracil phosphoribosyltransferase [Apiospora arundinis]
MEELLDFMDEQAERKPYPKYLYRAHVHGHICPRLIGDSEKTYVDTFGSDLHLQYENEAKRPLDHFMIDEGITVASVLAELGRHLGKTQTGLQQSKFVSLSANFSWTAQRTCSVGQKAMHGKLPGLAIFETGQIISEPACLFRVEDMLKFLDQSSYSNSVSVDKKLRTWAANCDEYVCWNLVPRKATVAFVPLTKLRQDIGSTGYRFLRLDFVSSTYLGDFRKCPREVITLERYAARVSELVRNILETVPAYVRIEQLVDEEFASLFHCPNEFGYAMADQSLLETKMLEVVRSEMKLASDNRAATRRQLEYNEGSCGRTVAVGEDCLGTAMATLSISR